jgi:uracil-DNA glycosylase family 4
MPTPKSKQNLSCITCKLRDGDVLSPKMEAYGEGKKGILIIGEAPGQVEDRKGLPWQGGTGRLLQRTLAKLGIDLFEDCVCVNAVNCRPPNNRTPKAKEIDCCREVIVRHVYRQFQPHIIVPLGTVALQSFLSPRWPTNLGGISQWHGFIIPDRDYNAWVVPTFHPSYIARMDSREANTVWEKDLAPLSGLVDVEVPKYIEPKIHYLQDLSVLEKLQEAPEIAFDYETTGLKAQRKGHRIVCVSVAINMKEVYVFMLPETKVGRKPFIDLLTNPSIGKMAHNMKFEHSWTYHRLGVEIKNWQWDSMIAAHMLDNRSGVTGLKFQTYANFGVVDYSSEITPYLRKREEGGNGMNGIYELLEEEGGKEKLLKYCALDSHYQYMLSRIQMAQLDYKYLPF